MKCANQEYKQFNCVTGKFEKLLYVSVNTVQYESTRKNCVLKIKIV